MSVVYNYISSFTEGVGKVVSWLSLVLVVLVGVDVALRYLFNWTSSANQEMEWHVFATLFLLGMAYSLKHDKHVRVDVFYTQFSDKNKAIVNLVGTIIFLIPFAAIILLTSFSFVYDAYVISESSAEPGGLPYRFIIKATIPLSAFLLLVQAIAEILKSIQIIFSSKQS